MSATDYLSALNWGTSTGGAAGSAETTSTLGTARLDTREPPSQYHVSGLQITRLSELALAMSAYFKGGTRLRVLKQSSNPFGGTETGFYISDAGVPYYVVDGTPTAITAGGTTQTIDTINATAATGKTLTAAVANSGTNVGFIFNNSTTLSGTTLLASFRNNGTQKFSIEDDGTSVSSGSYTFAAAYGGDLGASAAAAANVYTRHIVGKSAAAPTIAAGAGLGASPTVTVDADSTDISGSFNLTAGTGTTGTNATLATITFNTAYGVAPKAVIMTPANATAVAMYGVGTNVPFVDQAATTTTQFVVKSGNTAVTASTGPYKFFYVVIQ